MALLKFTPTFILINVNVNVYVNINVNINVYLYINVAEELTVQKKVIRVSKWHWFAN